MKSIIKEFINGGMEFFCDLRNETVTAEDCFETCDDKCKVPKGTRLSILRGWHDYESYASDNKEKVNFRVHDLIGDVCVRKLVFKTVKPVSGVPSIDMLNKTERGKVLHEWFEQCYDLKGIHLKYKGEIGETTFSINGEIDTFDLSLGQIVDFKTTEWMPSSSGKHGKPSDVEQVQIYDGLNKLGFIVKFKDINGKLIKTDDEETRLTINSLLLSYYNTAQHKYKATIGDYFEQYLIEKDPDLFEQKLKFVEIAVGILDEYYRTGKLIVPKKVRRKCAGCDYKGVYC